MATKRRGGASRGPQPKLKPVREQSPKDVAPEVRLHRDPQHLPDEISGRLVLINAAAAGMLPYLQVLAETRVMLDVYAEQLVRRARADGLSWAAIGGALRVSPQAVAKRYGQAADVD